MDGYNSTVGVRTLFNPAVQLAARLVAVLTGLSICMAGAATVSAQPRMQRGLRADPVLYFDVGYLGVGDSFTVEARAVEPTADPVLRLWSVEQQREVGWDDDSGAGRDARITYRAASAGHVIVIIHAAYAWSQGTIHLIFNGYDYGALPLAGHFIDIPCGTRDEVRAVAQPFGPSQLQLYGFPRDHSHLVAFDAMGGIGGDALLNSSVPVCSVILGRTFYLPAPAGVANLYVNDATTSDNDEDGVGTQLEAEVGTCDSTSVSGICSTVASFVDTDHDGLSDGDELFGYQVRASPHEPQNLPAWGANPLHKDAFYEVDWAPAPGSTATGSIIRAADVLRAAAYYTSSPAWPDQVGATAAEAKNPDGIEGIALHFDIGQPTPPGRTDMPYGNWGGGGDRLLAGTNYKTAYITAMRPIRRLAFRHIVAVPTGSGQTDAAPGRALVYNSTAGRSANILAHEIGHSLGLAHYGISEWGPVNCKPQYQSIMNYAYTDGSGLGLSHSDSRDSVTLNPSALNETAGIGNLDAALLRAGPWHFRVDMADGVDWNRDGRVDSAWTPCLPGFGGCTGSPTSLHLVKAPLNDTYGLNDCGTYANPAKRETLLMLSNKDNPAPTDGTEPAMVHLHGRIYVLWMDAAHQWIHYRFARIGRQEWDDCQASPSGNRGDRINIDGTSSPECLTFSAEHRLWLPGAHGVNALSWNGVGYLAWANGRGLSVHRLYDYSNGQLVVSSIGFDETASAWSTPRVGPTLATLQVDPGRHHGHSEIISVFYRYAGTTYGAWRYSDDGRTWLSGGVVLESGGAPLPHIAPPAFASIPGHQTCSVFPVSTTIFQNPHLEAYCFDAVSERFSAVRPPALVGITPNPFYPTTVWTGLHRPSLAFHVFRDSHGQPVHGDVTEGQFALTFTPRTNGSSRVDQDPRIFLSNPIRGSSDALAQLIFPVSKQHRFVNYWARSWNGTGITLLEDESLSALKAVWLNGVSTENDYKGIDFYPSVLGTYSVQLSTGNDFVELEKRMCSIIASNRSAYLRDGTLLDTTTTRAVLNCR